MKRIAVINQALREVYIEDISDTELEKYDGDLEAYIADSYYESSSCVWGEVFSACYIPEDSSDVIEIDLKELI